MPISRNDYAAKAEELKRKAEAVRDPEMRHGYLKLALELSRLAQSAPGAIESDDEVERLAERMVGSSPSKL